MRVQLCGLIQHTLVTDLARVEAVWNWSDWRCELPRTGDRKEESVRQVQKRVLYKR
jgi:hypothetical protein